MLKYTWLDENWKWSSGLPFGAGGVGSALGMFVAMFLDTTTPMATPLWVSIWVIMTVAPIILMPLMYALSAYRGLGREQRRALEAYYSLPKEVSKELPSSMASVIKSSTWGQAEKIRFTIEELQINHARVAEIDPARVQEYHDVMDALERENQLKVETYNSLKELD